MINLPPDGAIYLAKPEFLIELKEELPDLTLIAGDLFFSAHQKIVCFAQDIWFDPKIVRVESISSTAKLLRQTGRFWYLHPIEQVRRSRLIEAQLRKIPALSHHFPPESEIPEIGAFSLLDQNTLIYSANRLKKWPDGRCMFIEDKINPPNRAYLKLWEALSFLKKYPKSSESALDLGASPGGWTYVMQALGCDVTAIDKALLAPKISKLPRVKFVQQSGFAFDPYQIEAPYDWVLSDIACYPARALELIKRWIASGNARQMIFTIKLQGKTDIPILKEFQAIPNSCIINLYHNKHEATFFYPAPVF